jgi:hypothetical protein
VAKVLVTVEVEMEYLFGVLTGFVIGIIVKAIKDAWTPKVWSQPTPTPLPYYECFICTNRWAGSDQCPACGSKDSIRV